MAAIETTRSAPLGSVAIFRVINAFDAVLTSARTWLIARRTDSALRGLSDAQLRDIGLSRGEIEDFCNAITLRR